MNTTNPEGLPWTLVRRCPQVTDKVLLNDTKAWLDSLPAEIQPVLLHRDYPRIANELVLVWSNTAALRQKLKELLSDRRGNRQGFPPLVREELTRLQASADAREGAWDLALG